MAANFWSYVLAAAATVVAVVTQQYYLIPLAFSAGFTIGNLIFPQILQHNLDDIRSAKSAYGEFIPIVYNTVRLGGNLVWASIVRAKERGHGGYEYGQDCFFLFSEGPVSALLRFWLNKQLVLDNREGANPVLSNINALIADSQGVQVITPYFGAEDQEPPALIAAEEGYENVNGYRGVFCVMAANLPLHLYGNAIPTPEAEFSKLGAPLTEDAFIPMLLNPIAAEIYTAWDFSVVPDWLNNTVYLVAPDDTNTYDYLLVNDLATGELIRRAEVGEVCVVSGNTVTDDFGRSACLGVDGYLYYSTTKEFPDQVSALQISKIDPFTLKEVGSMRPVYEEFYDDSLTGRIIKSFRLQGVNYIAFISDGSNGTGSGLDDDVGTGRSLVEFWNADTLEVVTVSEVLYAGGDGYFILGEQPDQYTQNLYWVTNYYIDNSGDATIVKITFKPSVAAYAAHRGLPITSINGPNAVGNGVVQTLVARYVSTDFDAGWVDTGSESAVVSEPVFDHTDSTIIFAVYDNESSPTYRGTAPAYVVKASTVDDTVLWQVPVPDTNSDFHWVQYAAFSKLSAGSLFYLPPDDAIGGYVPPAHPADTWIGYMIDTATGDYTVISSPRIEFNFLASVWDSTTQRLIYYADEENAVPADNYREGFAVLGIADDSVNTVYAPYTLADICEDQSLRTPLTAGNLQYTVLSGIIPKGYAITGRATAKANIEALMPAWQFDISESEYKLKATLREGNVSIVTINEEECVAEKSGNQNFQFSDLNELEIPRWLDVSYYDIDRDYAINTQSAERSGSGPSDRNATRISLPVVMNAFEGKQAAVRNLRALWSERGNTSFKLSSKYLYVEPSDVVILAKANGYQHQTKIVTNAIGANWMTTFDGVSYDTGSYSVTINPDITGSGVGNSGSGGFVPISITIESPPLLAVLDTAMLYDLDNLPGLYVVAYPVISSMDGGTWTGADVQKSADQVSYADVATMSGAVGVGVTISELEPTTSFYSLDTDNEVGVQFDSRVTFTSATYAQVIADPYRNLFYLDGELFQAMTCTQLNAYTWAFSNLLRGRFGTEQFIDTHAEGEQFVQIAASAIRTVNYSQFELDATRYYRAHNTSPAPYSTPIEVEQTTRRLMCYAPFYISGVRVADDLTVSFLRRSRAAGTALFGSPLFEDEAVFECDIYDGVAVVRTITSTASANGSVVDPDALTVYYDEDDQVLDFGSAQAAIDIKIYQLNAIRGRGYPGSKTV